MRCHGSKCYRESKHSIDVFCYVYLNRVIKWLIFMFDLYLILYIYIFDVIIIDLIIILDSLYVYLSVSKEHSKYNLNNKAVWNCFENKSEKFVKEQACTEKLHWERASSKTFVFRGFIVKSIDFLSGHVFKRGTPKTLHTYWNYIQKCSRPRFFYYYTYTCFHYVQNCFSFDIRNELLSFVKSSRLEFF